MTIWRMRFAFWVTEATNTNSEHVVIAFPQQQWYRERVSVLLCMHVACVIPVVEM